MRILRVITRLNIGGPAINAILLTKGLSNGEFESLLVSGSLDKSEGDMSYLADSFGIRHIKIKELKRPPGIKDDLIALWRLYLLIKKEKPDILHTHTAKAGTLGRIAAILAGVKVKIHTFHGHTFHSYFGSIKTKIFIFIEKVLSYFTSKIICISETQLKDVKRALNVLDNKLCIVPLGFDLDRFLNISAEKDKGLQKSLGFSDNALTIGIIGRLTEIKNHNFFLDAACKLIKEYVKEARFIIVGDGPLRNTLQAKAKQLGIGEYVRFLGWQKDLDGIYSGLDIVALTSLNEGTPVSIIEAMASSRAVVATNVGGVGDIIIDGKTGFLCSPNDIEYFVKKLIYLLDNPQERKRFGLAGREFVRQRFSKDRLVEDIKKLYLEELRIGGA